MRCDRIQGLLSAYQDGELPARQAARVAGHLQTCAACAEEARALSFLVGSVRSLPEEEPPATLRPAIFAALDQVEPTLWDRLRAGLAPLQPSMPLAFSAAAAGLVVLGLTAVPLQHGMIARQPGTQVAFVLPTRPIHLTPSRPAVSRPSPPPAAEPKRLELQHPPALPPVVRVEPEPTPFPEVAELPKSHPAPQPQPVVAAPGRVMRTPRKLRPGSEKPRAAKSAPSPTPTFDPLATVLQSSGSPSDPAMPNVVVTDAPAVAPQSDTTVMASMPDTGDMPPASTDSDDLTALRQRLSRETIQLPPIRIHPQQPKTRRPPILRGDF